MQKSFTIQMLVCAVTIITLGCAPRSPQYITPDYKEYTTGGIFADKYVNFYTGGANVRLEGSVARVIIEVVSRQEQVVLQMQVPGGNAPVSVHSSRAFWPQLLELKVGEGIIVYGETQIVTSRARIDRGVVQRELAVKIHKLERKSVSFPKQ